MLVSESVETGFASRGLWKLQAKTSGELQAVEELNLAESLDFITFQTHQIPFGALNIL